MEDSMIPLGGAYGILSMQIVAISCLK